MDDEEDIELAGFDTIFGILLTFFGVKLTWGTGPDEVPRCDNIVGVDACNDKVATIFELRKEALLPRRNAS